MAVKEHISSHDYDSARDLFPQVEDTTTLRVAVKAMTYSASGIARAVEDCNANLLNLNVTGLGAMPRDYTGEDVIVDLRVDLRHSMAVVRSLERYGYRVLSATSSDGHDMLNDDAGMTTDVIDDTLRDRVNLLLRLME